MVKIMMDMDELTVKITGHAGTAPAGQDIVCAAVSTVYQWLIFSLEELSDQKDCVKKLEYTQEPGDCRLYTVPKECGRIPVRQRFLFAREGFELIADNYPENVKLEVY